MSGLEMRYFVLSPASGDQLHAQASRNAIRQYALAVGTERPQMAKDLLQWVADIESPAGNTEFEQAFDTQANTGAQLEGDQRQAEIDHEGADIRQERPAEEPYPGAFKKAEGEMLDEMAQIQSVSRFNREPEVVARAPNLLLDGPPDGWHIERDAKQNPTGYLIKTEDGTRKWHTDKIFHEILKG